VALPGNHLEDRHAPGAKHPNITDVSYYSRHFTGPKFVYAAWVEPVFIAKGQIVEHVFDGEDVFPRQPFCYARADALYEFDFGREIQHFVDDTSGQFEDVDF
jgi:hypothetical protein